MRESLTVSRSAARRRPLVAGLMGWLWAMVTSGVLLWPVSALPQAPKVVPLPLAREIREVPSAANRPTSNPGTVEVAAQLLARLAEAEAELNRTLALQGGSTNLPSGATLPEVLEYRSLLQALVSTYRAHLNDLRNQEATRQQQEDLNRTISAWTGFAEPPPYSVLMVDELRDSVQSLTAKTKASQSAEAIMERFLADSETARKQAEGRLRLISEQLEAAKEPTAVARLTWQRMLEQARSRAATAAVARWETRRRAGAEELAERRQRLAFTQRQLALASQQVRFSQNDLDRVLARLEGQYRQLEQELQAAHVEQQSRQKALAEARESLRLALETSATAPTNATARNAELRRLQDLVEVRSVQADTSVQRMTVLRQVSDLINSERAMWQMRFASAGIRDLTRLQESYRRLNHLNELAQIARPYFQQQIDLAANQVTETQNRLLNQIDPLDDPALTRERLESFQQREQLYHRGLRSLEQAERLVVRWKEALDLDRRSLPFTERVRDLFTGVSTFTAGLWNFELIVVEDTIKVDGQPITGRRAVTVSKIAMAIVILVLGYFVSRVAARLVERLAVRRLKIEGNQASLIRRWVMVVLVLCLVVFSLVSVKIPLTIFAFAGGALAIGVGFGTQNLLKNFISGIILLFERPFRVGDVLDLGGQRGTLTSIGIRSSVIQLWDNTETIIPNSALLENNVTNWTYSSQAVRFIVTVGVAYGSDTRRVAQLLAEVAERHGLVRKDPKPQVLFTEFGDSALIFELRYWVDILRSNAAQVASDLRHMIGSAFAEAGIGIPFPQRDLNLTAAHPLQVQVLPAEEPAPPAASSEKSGGETTPA